MTYPIAVIAGKDAEYDNFMHWVDLSDRENFVFIKNAEDLYGHLFSSVLRIGNYEIIRDHKRLYEDALSRVRHL